MVLYLIMTCDCSINDIVNLKFEKLVHGEEFRVLMDFKVNRLCAGVENLYWQ